MNYETVQRQYQHAVENYRSAKEALRLVDLLVAEAEEALNAAYEELLDAHEQREQAKNAE